MSSNRKKGLLRIAGFGGATLGATLGGDCFGATLETTLGGDCSADTFGGDCFGATLEATFAGDCLRGFDDKNRFSVGWSVSDPVPCPLAQGVPEVGVTTLSIEGSDVTFCCCDVT